MCMMPSENKSKSTEKQNMFFIICDLLDLYAAIIIIMLLHLPSVEGVLTFNQFKLMTVQPKAF